MSFSRKYFGLTFGITLSVSLLVYACGGGGGSSSGGGGTTTTPISSPSQGSQAASSGAQGAQAGTGLSDIATSLGQVASAGLGLTKPVNPLTLKNAKYAKILTMNNKVAQGKIMQKVATRLKAVRSKAAFAPVDLSTDICTDGGTVSGNFDATASGFSMDLTFTACREDGSQTDGPISLTGNSTDNGTTTTLVMDITVGSNSTPLTITGYTATDYATVEGVFESTVDLSETFSMNNNTGAITFNFEIDGSASFDDQSVSPSQTTNITFTNFANSGSFTLSGTDGGTFSNTLNGGISQSYTDETGTHSVAIGFTDFATAVEIATTQAGSTIDLSYSGTMTTDFTPDTDCGIEGTFSFTTETPIQYVDGANCPVQGHVVINGNTDLVFNSDGSVDVTVGNNAPQHFDTCENLFSDCEVEDDFGDLSV